MSILTTSQNLRVIASYYSRITMTRLTELLDLPPLTTERTICKLVTDKTIYARIDRPAGIVSFKQTKGVNEVLNAWSGDIAKMLSLVEKTSHLVAKVGWIRWWESAIATTCSRSAKT
jgi:26S proteasome regulatory subunit N5